MKKEKKTSEDWYTKERKEKKYKILDYDCWDIIRFNYSWWTEKITYEKYRKDFLTLQYKIIIIGIKRRII